MKFLRFVLFALFGLLATLFGIAYFKTSVWTAEAAIIVETAPDKVLPLVASPKQWLNWNLWSDPTEEGFEATFEGPESGPGATLRWKSLKNNGRLTIQAASLADGVDCELDLDDMPGKARFRLEPYGVQTRVRWSYSGDLGGNLGARFILSWIEKGIQTTMQKGLGNLRTKVLAGG
jgi:Polyketide cyclase / dehydrase and lipid transport